jgi:solute carrier family 25 carnitine/acylcarnitine transporter 20/29
MQTDGFTPETAKYRGAWHAFRTVLATEGAVAFTRGLIPTLIRCVHREALTKPSLTHIYLCRSPFANGATFLGFEMANRLLNSPDEIS